MDAFSSPTSRAPPYSGHQDTNRFFPLVCPSLRRLSSTCVVALLSFIDQVRASMISRSRATARAEAWVSLTGAAPETSASPPESPPSTAAACLTLDHGEDKHGQLTLPAETGPRQPQEESRQPGRKKSAEKEEGEATTGGAAGASTGGRKRGRVLAARAAERRRRAGERERELERELLVRRAEAEAEREVKR